MLTNRIRVTYNMEQIDADFDIYKVEKANKDYYKHNILDSAIYEFKAAAVQWTYGATALVLFRKGEVTEQKFKESVMKEYEDVKIQKLDILDSDQCSEHFYYENRLLAQLLLNSMRTPKHHAFTYHNLTGKLLYQEPSWIIRDKETKRINFMRFLEVVIDPGMYLNLNHTTYKRTEKYGKSLYVIDPKTGEFRKKLIADENMDTFVKGSMAHNHFHVTHFDVTNYKRFKESKIGIMEQFLRDVRELLSEYLTIEITEREDAQCYNLSKLEKKGMTGKEYGEMLNKRNVIIVNENDTAESKDLVEKLKYELETYYGVHATEGVFSNDAYHIRVIHDEAYYEKHGLYDPHKDKLSGYIVQHITEEAEHFTNAKGSSADIRKIVQELIIKGDVREKKISIFDWERLDSGKEWFFVIRKKIKTQEQEETEHMNHANNKAYHYYNYYRLKIERDGTMKFDTFCDQDPNISEEWEQICYAYDYVEGKHRGVKDQVEGLVYSELDNIHVILLTREKTLPNMHVLMDTLKETDVREKVSTDVLLKALEEFEKEHPESKESIWGWKQKLNQETLMITKKKVKEILNMRSGIVCKFNRFLHEKYNIWIDGELRKAEFEADYQISSLLDIKYEYNDNDYLDGDTFVYYVGAKSKQRSYPSACCMRKVVSMGDTLEYEELLPLMAVEFVRNGQYTVLPFPFKYLREYVEQSGNTE